MKQTLKEDLERIHTLTYGKPLTEGTFMDKILKSIGINKDEKKADVVSADVEEFFKTLENASTGNGITQQEKGSMNFQKEVESMQIGLELLGYELPTYGVDGLFGPETARAVSKFKKDHLTINEAASEISSTASELGYSIKGGQLNSGGEVTDNISGIVADILKEFKSTNPKTKVTVTAGNDTFHKKLGYKSKHVEGNAIDVTLTPYNNNTSNAFIEVLNKYKQQNPNFSFMDEYKHPSSSATGGHFHLQYGKGGSTGTSTALVSAEPAMLIKLIELLKQKGVKSEDLKAHTNVGAIAKYAGSNDDDFYKAILEGLAAPISKENMKFIYGWRQAEGKSGNYNPFNTTWKMPNSTSVNSHGVQSYASAQDGLVATLKTLKMGRYSCITEGLRRDIGADNIAQCESLKTWGTGDLVVKVLTAYNSGAQPKVPALA
jgi:peptidoglycan hydrolase-like protein with peptidoglycan-binding domain